MLGQWALLSQGFKDHALVAIAASVGLGGIAKLPILTGMGLEGKP